MKFRQWLRSTELLEEEDANNLKHMLDAQGLILFFKKGKEYYGAGEDSRVVFARLKHPDDETPSGWTEEANFTAHNLAKMVRGEPCQHIFSKSDIKKIKVVDRDKAVDAIKNIKVDAKPSLGPLRIIKFSQLLPHDRDDAPNFVRADEK